MCFATVNVSNLVNPFIDLIEDGLENCHLEWGELIEEYIKRVDGTSSTLAKDLYNLYNLDCIGSQFITHGGKDTPIGDYVLERLKKADAVLAKYQYDPHNKSHVSPK